MILFVLEGGVEEPRVIEAIKQHFFLERANEIISCSFGGDNHGFFKRVKEHMENGFEPDVFTIMKDILNKIGNHSLDKYQSKDISEIYLFFDYDIHSKRYKERRESLCEEFQEMMDIFSDPMDKGQLFFSYPMSEALYCINSANDEKYIDSAVCIDECHSFKQTSNSFAFGNNRTHLIVGNKETWMDVVRLNVAKAYRILNGTMNMPKVIEDVSQTRILNKQIDSTLSNHSFYILSSYPMFLYEYFSENGEF